MPAFAATIPGSTTLEVLTGALLVGLVVAAVCTDLRSGRIPNRLTMGAAAAGLLLNVLLGGLNGALASGGGWLLGAGLLFAFFAVGALGAGDVKLLAAVGALKGPAFAFNAFVFTGVAGGIIAIIVLVRRRRVRYAVASVAAQVQGLVYTGSISRPKDPKSSPLRFPYGLAIAAGSLAALLWRL